MLGFFLAITAIDARVTMLSGTRHRPTRACTLSNTLFSSIRLAWRPIRLSKCSEASYLYNTTPKYDGTYTAQIQSAGKSRQTHR